MKLLESLGHRLTTIVRLCIARRGLVLVLALFAAVNTSPASAATEWLEVRTTHFVVITQDSEDRARTFAGRLERYDKGMRMLQHLPEIPSDKANPVTIYVVPGLSAIGKLCQGTDFANAKAGCRSVGGWYEGRVSGSVAFIPRPSGSAEVPDEAAMAMFHEYAHHFMLSNFAGIYPPWYVEGFAEFHATVSFESKGLVGFGKPQIDHMRWLAYYGALPIEKLLTSNVAALNTEEMQSFYSEGWLLVHYLTFEKSRAGQLQTYLTEINAGKPSLDAARTAFGDLRKLDRELDGYLRSPSLYYVRFQVPELTGDAITVRRLTAGEAAMMPVRLQSRRGVDPTSAKSVVADARRLAAPYPNDPGAQIALAEAEYDAGNDDAAQAAADRALAAQPTNRTAMEYEGMARVRRLRTSGGGDAKTWQEARSWFIRANHLEPNDGWALDRFYRSFLAEGIAPTKSAVAGLEVAYAAVPQDSGLRVMLAMQYLHDGNRKDARQLLAPLAYDPHAPADNPARKMLAWLDKGDNGAIETVMQTGKLEEDDLGDDSKDAPGDKGGGKPSPPK